MKALSTFILFTVTCFTTVQLQAQMGDPNNGGTTAVMTCPDDLMFSYPGSYFYQLKNCTTGLMTDDIGIFSSEITTGCSNTTTCNCGSAPNSLAKYADANGRLFVPFGGGVSTHQSTKALETVKAGGKVFRTISIRLKGKKTSGADNELECIALFGLEVDPGTVTTSTGTLNGNKLTYDGREFTVLMKAPPSTNGPN